MKSLAADESSFDFKNHILNVADFPIAGVMFRDISPILASPAILDRALNEMMNGVETDSFDSFVGIESRGFILAAALAQKFRKGFVPLRKAGKLPPPFLSKTYLLEYGEATLEMRAGSGRVVIIDDVLATGGTLAAAIDLSERCGFTVTDVSVLIDLRFLNDFCFSGRRVRSAIQYA